MAKQIIQCTYCNKEFARESKRINESKRLGIPIYCSLECSAKAHTIKQTYICPTCGQEFYSLPSRIKKAKNGIIYCSHKCANITNGLLNRDENHIWYKTGKSSYREKALQYYGAQCRVCGYDIETALEVHHKDCNRKHNKVENLDVLCPTHHREYQLGIRIYD